MQTHRSFHAAVAGVGLIFFLRIFAAISLLPLIAIYGPQYLAANPFNIGLALGAYGLSQALLQIPFGMVSDVYGRRKTVSMGLIIASVGSFIAAGAANIYGLILGRLVQGAGAVGSTLLAWFADISDDSRRARGMAIIGITIAVAFSASIALGPAIAGSIGIKGLFMLSGALYLAAVLVANLLLPESKQHEINLNHQVDPRQALALFKDKQLMLLLVTILLVHVVHTTFFYLFPSATSMLFSDHLHGHWQVYAVAMISAFVISYPMIGLAEVRRKHREFMLLSWVLIVLSVTLLAFFHHHRLLVFLLTIVFFIGFICLEALLPSAISSSAPAGTRGTAMGLFSTCQFTGVFIGGLVGGLIGTYHHLHAFEIASALVFLLGFFALYKVQNQTHIKHIRYIWLEEFSEYGVGLPPIILELTGVMQVTWSPSDYTFYLKVDKRHFDVHALRTLLDEHTGNVKD